MSYRFDELGWLQFERLCAHVVEAEAGISRDAWSHHRAPWAAFESAAGIAVPSAEVRLLGPAVILAAWVRERQHLQEVMNLALGEDRKRGGSPRSLLVLTNVEPASEDRLAVDVGVAILGPRELSACLDARPEVRLRFPSVLGVRDLADLIGDDVRARCTADLAEAERLARVFATTRAYSRALAVLERHRFAVLTGPPEMGKTAIARMIALAAATDGWEAHECISPEQLWRAFAPDRRQVFVADDAFGSTEYRPDAGERWARELDRVLRALDARHRLIWTSRPAPLKAGLRRIHRERGAERFPQPAEVQVDARDLDVAEKVLILFRHAKAAGLTPEAADLVRTFGWDIVSHEHFTPERMRRFVAVRLPALADAPPQDRVFAAVHDEIREPTEAMVTSLRALGSEHRALLVALLDAPPGPVCERDLAAAARRHAGTALPRPPAELVDRLTDHFLRLIPPTSVTWVHPSWRDLVIDELSADARARAHFLANCSIDGALLALSVGGGAGGERAFPLLVADADWDALTDRLGHLVAELDDVDLARLLSGLRAGVEQARDPRDYDEVAALAVRILDVVRRAWDAGHRLIPVGLLEGWLALAEPVPEAPPAPELAATWIELLPTDRVDVRSAAELARFEEWLTLADVLCDHAPATLEAYGFPDRQNEIIEAVLFDAAALEPGEVDTRARVALTGVLARLSRLSQAYRAANAAAALLRTEVGPTPSPDPVLEPERPPLSEYSLVARVLKDL